MERVLLLKMGEMVLKGLNRSRFEQALLKSIGDRLRPIGAFDIVSRQSAIYIQPKQGADVEKAFEACSKVFGIAGISVAYKVDKELDAIKAAAMSLPGLGQARSFKVEAKRADKMFPLTSPEICAEIGGAILDSLGSIRVDVHDPEYVVWVEVRESGAFVHPRPASGAGGLPDATAGKAVLMLSGGIDSPVAGWRMARRGLSLLPLHFFSYPYTSEDSKKKVLELARRMSLWCGRLNVWVVPFTDIQESIRKNCPEDLFTLLMRRSMCRIAEAFAGKRGAGAIITGESLGQVASQTLESMAVTSEVCPLPILRPLVGMDKEEIVSTARLIDTFETSILPFEDCCTVFTPKHPKTKPKLSSLLEAEKLYAWRTLEEEAVNKIEKIEVNADAAYC